MSKLYTQIKQPIHELNTSLAIIRMGLGLIDSAVTKKDVESPQGIHINQQQLGKLREVLKNIIGSADDMQNELNALNDAVKCHGANYEEK